MQGVIMSGCSTTWILERICSIEDPGILALAETIYYGAKSSID
jgi:hypothetical protein